MTITAYSPSLNQRITGWDPKVCYKSFQAIKDASEMEGSIEDHITTDANGNIGLKPTDLKGAFAGFVYGNYNGEDDIKKSLAALQEKFYHGLKMTNSCLDSYRFYAKKLLEGADVSTEESKFFYLCGDRFSDWCKYTLLMRQVHHKKNQKILDFFKKFNVQFEHEKFKEHWSCYKLTSLESKVRQSTYQACETPYRDLYRLARGETLAHKATSGDAFESKGKMIEKMQKWVKQLHQTFNSLDSKDPIKPHLIHRVFKLIVELSADPQADKVQALVLLELEIMLLEENQNLVPSLFSRIDPTYDKERSKITAGTQFHFELPLKEKITVTIKQELIAADRPRGKPDTHRVFEVDHSDYVVVVGPNETYTSVIQKLLQKRNNNIIPVVKYIAINEKGVALVERMHRSLGDVEWTSCDVEIKKEDLEIASPVAALIKKMVRNERTFQNFTCEGLMLRNSEGRTELVSTKPLKETPNFDWVQLERVVSRFAGKKEVIYQYLIKMSEMKNYFYVEKFQFAVEYALGWQFKKSDKPVSELELESVPSYPDIEEKFRRGKAIGDSRILKKTKKLYKSIKKLHEDCFEEICTEPENKKLNKEELKKSISRSILKRYEKTGSMLMLRNMDIKEICAEAVNAMKTKNQNNK